MMGHIDWENKTVFFNNYGKSMLGFTQSGFELVLNQACRRGARVATLSPLYLGKNWQCKEFILPVGKGKMSWNDSYVEIKVYVYNQVLQ